AAVEMQRDRRPSRRNVAAAVRMAARADECTGLAFLENRRADEMRLHMALAAVGDLEIVDAERSLQHPLDAPETIVVMDRRRVARWPDHDQSGVEAVALALEQP